MAIQNSVRRQPETPRLVALLDGEIVGNVYQDTRGRFRFIYLDGWRESTTSYPISLSMPLSASEHQHEVVNAFLWGLLPDNTQTLEYYAQRFSVSSGNPAALLAHLGEDCAGAIQFAIPERIDTLKANAKAVASIEWLSVTDIAAELRSLRQRGVPSSYRTGGQFSLAGAQPKIALLYEHEQWGRPSGRTPTTSILKPPSTNFPGFAENEHLCLELARRIGLGAVHSRVLRFADEVAIVVDRFDRTTVNGTYHRIHQEDMCQALGITPIRKYQSDGGPGIPQIVQLLREASQKTKEDVDRFLGAMVLNWIIAATDGHAKNYALLHGEGSVTRLAPFYDIASYLPYTRPELYKIKLAMKIGSQYEVRRVNRGHWEALAEAIDIRPAELLALAQTIVDSVLALTDEVKSKAIEDGLDKEVVSSLIHRIHERAKSLAILDTQRTRA